MKLKIGRRRMPGTCNKFNLQTSSYTNGSSASWISCVYAVAQMFRCRFPATNWSGAPEAASHTRHTVTDVAITHHMLNRVFSKEALGPQVFARRVDNMLE